MFVVGLSGGGDWVWGESQVGVYAGAAGTAGTSCLTHM